MYLYFFVFFLLYCKILYCIVSSYFSLFFVFYFSVFSAYVANKRLHNQLIFMKLYRIGDVIAPDWRTRSHIFDSALTSVFAEWWRDGRRRQCDSPRDVASVARRTTSCSHTACSDVWSAPTCDWGTSTEKFLQSTTSRSYQLNQAFLTLLSARVVIVPHRIIWSWYTGRWWVGCYILYSEEGPRRAAAPLSPLLAVSNVTTHPSTTSVPITVLLYNGPLLCSFNETIKGLTFFPVHTPSIIYSTLWHILTFSF